MSIKLYKYDTDIPKDCYAVNIKNCTIYLSVSKNETGIVTVTINHGYEPGSKEYKKECELFAKYEKAILRAARTVIANLEKRQLELPTLQVRLRSDSAVYAPGLVRFAQQIYQEGARNKAREIVKCWDGIPDEIIEPLLQGVATTEIDAEQALIVTITKTETPNAS